MVKNQQDGKFILFIMIRSKNINEILSIYWWFYLFIIGVIFYQNEDGDVFDMQADIIGPSKSTFKLNSFLKRCHKFSVKN